MAPMVQPTKASPPAILAVLQAIAMILAVRFLLLLSILGAFTISCMSMHSQTQESIAILISYCVLVVLPMVWLSVKNPR